MTLLWGSLLFIRGMAWAEIFGVSSWQDCKWTAQESLSVVGTRLQLHLNPSRAGETLSWGCPALLAWTIPSCKAGLRLDLFLLLCFLSVSLLRVIGELLTVLVFILDCGFNFARPEYPK